MTDNDIIKALESEVKSAEYVESEQCDGGDLTLIRSAIDLINRQQAEIEELKIENKSLRSAANCYKLYYNEARTEAIKEFVEKLKKRYDNPVWYLGGSNGFFDNLDNFVKEMVGDTE